MVIIYLKKHTKMKKFIRIKQIRQLGIELNHALPIIANKRSKPFRLFIKLEILGALTL